MEFLDLTDESLRAYYESVRRQVAADCNLGGRYRLVGKHVQLYADRLKREMRRRRMEFKPIEWPAH
jgi:hypothetical protein